MYYLIASYYLSRSNNPSFVTRIDEKTYTLQSHALTRAQTLVKRGAFKVECRRIFHDMTESVHCFELHKDVDNA